MFILLSGGSIENIRAKEEIDGYCTELRLRATGATNECIYNSGKITVISSKWAGTKVSSEL